MSECICHECEIEENDCPFNDAKQENADLRQQIGTLPEGSHPYEYKPRGWGTWLSERACWNDEVNCLRQGIGQRDREIADLRQKLAEQDAGNMDLLKQNQGIEDSVFDMAKQLSSSQTINKQLCIEMEWLVKAYLQKMDLFEDAQDLALDYFNKYNASQAENSELSKKVGQFEAVNRWIPVGERLPEKINTYLVCIPGPEGKPYIVISDNLGGKFSKHVTHWMPLPASPKDGGQL